MFKEDLKDYIREDGGLVRARLMSRIVAEKNNIEIITDGDEGYYIIYPIGKEVWVNKETFEENYKLWGEG